MRFSERDRPRPRRQEEYGDYAERDIDEGWPYGDGPAAGSRRSANAPYGSSRSNFDRERNPGFHDTDERVEGFGPADAYGDDDFSRPEGGRAGRRRSDASADFDLDRGGPDHRGKGPRGYKRSDERIREDVSDRLTDEAQLDPSEVEVTVVDGEVTLTGHVGKRFEKRLAEDWAETVTGVVHVQNNIRVRPSE
jgi:hypothetical protein